MVRFRIVSWMGGGMDGWVWGQRSRAGIVAVVLLLAIGCDNSTTGPKTNGLTIESLDLESSSSGCKLKVTLSNHTGTDLSGQLGYNFLDAQKNVIAGIFVFPNVPDGSRRTATSDFITGGDGHRLVCSEIASMEIVDSGNTVPIAL
jgi:hypothetical protein